MARNFKKRGSIVTRRTAEQLREDAVAIWNAGVHAVLGDQLVKNFVRWDEDQLWLGDEWLDLSGFDRLVVVGGGKAGGAMAIGLEEALRPVSKPIEMKGLLNIPEGCNRPTEWIELHEARPPGVNEPTTQGVEGTRATRLVRRAAVRRRVGIVAGTTGRDFARGQAANHSIPLWAGSQY